MHPKPILTIVLTLIISLSLLAFSGCEEALRFAPSESIKQTAELTHGLAKKVNTEGAEAGSSASAKLVEGTRAALSYTGRPKVPPDPEQFDTIAAQANQDASARPDPWAVADSMFELAIGVSALVGGVYGTKALAYLKAAREKSQALKEIIKNNELFLDKAEATAKNKFKQFQRKQSPATKRLVTELKTG
ncbi:MAG: hypothetical protein ACYTEQ_21590 [Planctomycetota bacterium]|jgi:hypothetical protein